MSQSVEGVIEADLVAAAVAERAVYASPGSRSKPCATIRSAQRLAHADLASPSSTNMRLPLVTPLELLRTRRLKPSARLAKGDILRTIKLASNVLAVFQRCPAE